MEAFGYWKYRAADDPYRLYHLPGGTPTFFFADLHESIARVIEFMKSNPSSKQLATGRNCWFLYNHAPNADNLCLHREVTLNVQRFSVFLK